MGELRKYSLEREATEKEKMQIMCNRKDGAGKKYQPTMNERGLIA